MRFHYTEGMTAIGNYMPLTQAAEANGFDGFAIPDGLVYPKASDTEYMYTDTGDRSFIEGKPFLDPFGLAMAMGAVTTTLQITTTVVKLPVRQPVYSAKLAFSAAAFTDNRFNFGVGASMWPEDFQAMGVPWEKRGKRMDECIEIIRGLETGDYFEYHSEFYDIPAVKMNPVPTKPLPILIGGQSEAAFRRAARNDGAVLTSGDLDFLAETVAKLHKYREEIGRQDKPFSIFMSSFPGVELDKARRMADIGITDIQTNFRNPYTVGPDQQPLAEKIDCMKRFGDEIIAKM